MEQLCPHWIDFHEIWYLRSILTFGEKILKPGKIICSLHEDRSRKGNVLGNCRENGNTHFIFSISPPPSFPPENRIIYERM